MARQMFSRQWVTGLATALIISLTVVGCGSTNAALSAPAVPAGAVAPTLGSPEQTAIELGNAKLDNNLDRVAPTLGSPEQTALEINPR